MKRTVSPVLLNKSGLVQADNLKFLNRCFSNYYQVQTWLVFAEMVTQSLQYEKMCLDTWANTFQSICPFAKAFRRLQFGH